jgi:hypothetical protein
MTAKSRVCFFIVPVVVLLSSVSFAEEAPSQSGPKQAKIRQLLESTGAGNLGVQMMNQMLPSFKKLVPQAPDSFWDDILTEAKPETFVDMVVPIYDRHFSETEIDELVAFYSSPIGKKAVQELPAIMSESMAVGQIWGQEVSKRVLERAKKAGLQPHT